MDQTHEHIGLTIDANIAAGRAWDEGLLLVTGRPVAVRRDVRLAADGFICPRVEAFLWWRIGRDYGAGLRKAYGSEWDEIPRHAVGYALDDLALHWLRKDRHLLLFLRDRHEAVRCAKEAQWLRAQQELNREFRRQRRGTGVVGDLRPTSDTWRAFDEQRNWSARMSRPADVCYFEMEDERRRSEMADALQAHVANLLREPEPERVIPRGA